jgi:hypothetical protein
MGWKTFFKHQVALHLATFLRNHLVTLQSSNLGSQSFLLKLLFPLIFNFRRRPGLPDFSWYNIPKRGKYTKMNTKYTKWP